MFEMLDKFDKIGLDFDKTLVDGYLSKDLVDYILKNKNKEYHIITFRTGILVDDIPFHLEDVYGIDFFDSGIIKSIISIPEYLYRNYMYAKMNKLDKDNIYYREYYNWKGDVCKEMGIEVMVDDNIMISENLKNNKISFINVF
jgi:hypothetical protein